METTLVVSAGSICDRTLKATNSQRILRHTQLRVTSFSNLARVERLKEDGKTDSRQGPHIRGSRPKSTSNVGGLTVAVRFTGAPKTEGFSEDCSSTVAMACGSGAVRPPPEEA